MVNGKQRLFFALGGVFLCFVFVVLVYSWSRTNGSSENTGYPVYISDIFVYKDEVIILRARSEGSIPREYDVYCIEEDGQEQYVQPYPGKAASQNKSTGKLYFLSDKELCEFDPITGQSQSYLVDQSYERICAAVGENVFMQQDIYGPIVMYSMSTGEEYELKTSGWVLDVYEEHLLIWDVYKQSLTCYSYDEDQITWTIDISEEFSSAPILCRNGENLYLANREGGYIYVIPQFAKKNAIEKTEASAKVIGMVNAEEYIVYAVKRSQSIHFYVLFLDGSSAELTEWENVNYYQDSSLVMTMHGGKLYCSVKTEEGLFSYDLRN